jgi:hypothetical protein
MDRVYSRDSEGRDWKRDWRREGGRERKGRMEVWRESNWGERGGRELD